MPKEPQFPWIEPTTKSSQSNDVPNCRSIGPFVDSEKFWQERKPGLVPYRFRGEIEFDYPDHYWVLLRARE